jgi:catalase
LPINAPKCPFAHHQRDGHMQMEVPTGRVAYEPQSLDPNGPRASRQAGFRSFAEAPDDGRKGRVRPASFADHYSQARMFFRSQSALEQAHMASSYVFELSKVAAPHIRDKIVGHLRNIDESLATRVADGLGMASLPAAEPSATDVLDLPLSPATRIIDRMQDTLKGRCVAILVADGSDAKGVRAMRTALTKAGAQVKLVAPKLRVTDADGKPLDVDGQLAGTPSVLFDAVASMLHPDAAERLAKEGAAVDWFRDAFGHLKAIAACGATRKYLLRAANIKPDAFVVEPEDTAAFVAAAKSRHWAREPRVRTLA